MPADTKTACGDTEKEVHTNALLCHMKYVACWLRLPFLLFAHILALFVYRTEKQEQQKGLFDGGFVKTDGVCVCDTSLFCAPQ